jgi:tetratricopeptide (TPR) repeat protein
MLETVREFSAARLAAAGETDGVTIAFLAWARQFGLDHHTDVVGTDPYDGVAAIRAEQENLLHALRLALGRGDLPTVAAVTAVLSGLWSLESNYGRMTALLAETARPLSHYRPEPAFVEVTRTALSMATVHAFAFQGSRPGRAVVALRRLGTAPPDTFVRAGGRVIGVLGDPEELNRLCDSTEPLLAAAANMMASYHWEAARDLDAALKCARRALDVLDLPWPRALVRSRLAELCLQMELGADARDHLTAAAPVLERLGARTDAGGVQAWLVLANLQLGDTDEAERRLDFLPPHTLAGDEAKAMGYDLALRAEVLLARGDADAGLRLWRRVLDLVSTTGVTAGVPPDLDPWVVEARSVAVVAHARHGRLDRFPEVAEVADALPDRLTHLLTHPLANPPPYLVEPAACGTLLLAVATADLARETGRDSPAARMIALAERFRFPRTFQPTMSGAAARADAERADRTAYDAAVSSYAALDGPALRAEALALLDQRVRSRL